MTNMLNNFGQQFAGALRGAEARIDATAANDGHAQKVHVTGAGRTLTFAYEQLRNAAEYTEEHLLLQRAIRRFYKRLFLTRDDGRIRSSGEELIVELTLAGYLQNDSVPVHAVEKISKMAVEYYAAHTNYNKDAWTIDILAVEAERLLNDDTKRITFSQFSYDHFLASIDKQKVLGEPIHHYEVALFVAVQRALLKSDQASIRASLLRRYEQTPNTGAYRTTNEMIDKVFAATTTERLIRAVDRRGAPFRILWRLIDEHEDFLRILNSREQFLSAYETQINKEYARIDKRINRGIIKSVIFLIITKVLIGVSIEVPYDYLIHGAIVWLPLAINLLFPPVYMILLRFTLTQPSSANTQALIDTIDELFYGKDDALVLSQRTNRGFGTAFNVLYSLFFLVIFATAAWGLYTLGFSALHMLIFFVFLSTASFLGFRLSRQIRELEVVQGQQDGFTVIRDFLYIPFVVVGRWMSEKYSRINIVATVLDMVIELPLKTVLYLMRQWGAFINSKKDEL
ncbi:MAG TPA: hypothetical protein VFH06_02415 [Candidatus Saccharimonadales bacterium]|nr:hypothetical protein [Candidatus Saccharimonadales bacterium]